MKKKILLLIIAIFSFTLYVGKVEADTKCPNSTDKVVDGHCCPEGYTAKVVEKSSYYFCLNSDYSDEELKKFSFDTVNGVFEKIDTEVPYGKCSSMCDNVNYFNCQSGSGVAGGNEKCTAKYKVGAVSSGHKLGCFFCKSSGIAVFGEWSDVLNSKCDDGNWELQTNINSKKSCVFSCNDKNSCENVNWLAKCEYEQLNVSNGETKGQLSLYFNQNYMKVFIDGSEIDSDIKNKIKLKTLLENYNNRKKGASGCPTFIYYIDHHYVDAYTESISKELTLSSKKFSLSSDCDTNTVCSDKMYKLKVKSSDDDNFQQKDYDSCDELIGSSTKELINNIMKWIRIAVPLLLIVLGIFDFAKATFSLKEEDIKKNREIFIKRIVAAVLVFLAPILVNLILDLANSVWGWISPETCIK